jgi:hypothetical protein
MVASVFLLTSLKDRSNTENKIQLNRKIFPVGAACSREALPTCHGLFAAEAAPTTEAAPTMPPVSLPSEKKSGAQGLRPWTPF